jgi:23S rRNA pseudouridine1911/1915/1917 synthase
VTRQTVRAPGTVLDSLAAMFPDAARRTLRQFLAHQRVRVNGAPARREKQPLRPGDVVEVGPPVRRAHLPEGITILYEDRDLIVVDKWVDLLTIATTNERERTAYALVTDYVRRERTAERVYIVHRIDRPTSGVLVFAKSEAAKAALQDQFRTRTAERTYLAIVEGAVDAPRGTLTSYLVEDRHLRVQSTPDPARGKLAVTHFRVLRRAGRHTVLEVTLETGRKGQIRVHLAEAGHPVVGDREHGSTTNPLKRLGLHAHRLAINHPDTGRRVAFEAPIPRGFLRFLAGDAPAARPQAAAPPPR